MLKPVLKNLHNFSTEILRNEANWWAVEGTGVEMAFSARPCKKRF
jgi:hypothetical protein